MSSPTSVLVVPKGQAVERLDVYLTRQGLPFSRSQIQRRIEEKTITVGGLPTKPSYRIRPGDRIEIATVPPRPLKPEPQEIPLAIVYEDEDLLIVDKPAGMVVHPAPGNPSGTLVNALLHHVKVLAVPQAGGGESVIRPGLVHRLDKETSGLLVVAKNERAMAGLVKQFKNHTIDRRYRAIVHGHPAPGRGRIALAIGRDLSDRKRFSARTASPKEAATRYVTVEKFSDASLVDVYPETGRTHQIRVHFASIGHPVLGDRTYGGRRPARLPIEVSRQMLHAAELGFIHPGTGEEKRFASPLPKDMQAVLWALRVP